jgi:hypothetical protein
VRGDARDTLARAAYLLRAHLLEQFGRRLAAERLEVLLVKGAALAITVYERPWDREMQDIDLLVRPGTSGPVIRILERMGLVVSRPPGRPLSREALGEVVLRGSYGGAPVLLEVHTQLDKLVSRPIDYAGIFARALHAPGLPGLLVPAPEDHALLVALHAAGHDFRHPVAFIDFNLLLKAGLDIGAVTERAHRWCLRTGMFVFLRLLRALDESSVPRELLEALDPGPLRRAVVSRMNGQKALLADAEPTRLGWPWVVRQTALRDDVARWCGGVLQYAALRGVERLQAMVHTLR